MEPLQRTNLYVTYVEKEGPFLKIWGQTDKNNSLFVEQFLAQVAPQFDLGVGRISPETLPPGTLICAKYKDDKYYRAKILNSPFVREGSLEVNFIDFGNKGVVPTGSIRSLQNFQPSIITVPPLALGFIFAEAHCVGGGEWNENIFDSIAKEIKYREVQCTLLTQATNYYLVRIVVEGIDLCNALIQRGLMQPISLQAQQAVLLSMSMQKLGSQTQNQSSSSNPQINTYKACSLEPGCQYPVYVSYVNDGPCHFSVQLKQTEDALVALMNDINAITLRLIEDIPIPGTICLARCVEDSNICRAVVTNEVDTQFKVFYVDFGNYEVLPLEALYQIPFKYVLPKVMAIRFALAGVEKSTVTMDMQIAFKKFVDNRLLHMKVLPSPTRTSLPKCELWDPETKTSALDVVIRAAKHSFPEPMTLPRGFSQPVKVSFVYSCNRFYVQLVNKESELTSLMAELQEVCLTSEPMNPSSIKVDLPCCALFSADGLWYRSQVVDVANDSMKVRYIDYGNEEFVPVDQLKNIEGEILTVLRPQAIECCLNGYQNMEPDDERDALLEELILEGVFTMKVVDTLNKKTLVDLFDESNYNVASLLLDKLAAAKSQISPVLVVQAGNKIEHRKSYSNQREQQNFNKGERNYNTGREQKSWEKPTDRNERSEKPWEKSTDRNERTERPWEKSTDRNERTEKPWRQDNRENRNYDKNLNENDDRPSWRQNNKGFSPNDRFDKKDDSWNTTDNTANNNKNWENNTKSNYKPKDSWNAGSNNASQDNWNNKESNDDWGTPANNSDDSRPQRNDFKSNRGGYNNRGGRGGGGGDRYGGGGGDRYGGKSWDGATNKRDYRKDDDANFSGSEKSYHKGPRSSSRNDNARGGHNFDKPRNNYNRDNKSGGGDSWNTTNTTTEDSWNVSAVTPSIDAAAATDTFKDYDVVGTDENVIISWFHNPGLFYVQQVKFQEAVKTMMEEICDFYKDKKPDRVVVGAPIIALFDEDNVLYRARVVEVLGTKYKVYYVDFGNVSTVSKAYPIDKKFMDLPAQAIPCSLNGITPPSEQWADPDSYSSYFDKETFLCRFVNKDEEKTFVNIFLDSEDIGQLLVNDGLAVSSSVPEIEIPLLLGQQFRATVKSVNNLSDIILALECGLAISCTMHNLETAVESFEDILKGLLEQAVIVYVDNVLEDYRLEITLYDTEGNKYIVLNPDEGAFETVDIPCPMLVLSSFVSGYVPHADETSVYIQPLEYADIVISLLDQLFEEYDGKEHDSTIIPDEGKLYAIHSEDGNWYRGKVICFDDEKATVNYVDYGNSEDVAFAELRELATKFLDINILSLQVSVASDAESFIDKNVTANIYFGEAGWEGTLQLLDSTSTALVAETEVIESLESTDTGIASSSIERTDNLQEETTESTVEVESETIAAAAPTAGTSIEPEQVTGNMVVMSHIDTPSDFYLQFYEAIDEINTLQAELQEDVPQMEVLENPIHGSLCAAPYAADQQWYRAEVLDADEDITTVRFVDFGNTDVIDNATTKVKTLPPKLLSMAIYATRCALRIEPTEEEWSSTAQLVFEQLANSGTLTAEFFEQDEKCTYVELYTDGINIKDALIKENLAKLATKATEGKQTGFVSHLNSPSEFWIQLENCVDELEWIAEQLSNAESFPELEELTPGTLCAALFPDDQMWYRARILSNTVAGIELLFIDYGNCCTSSSLRQLPEDLVITAPLALKCSLQKNEGIPAWSAEAAAQFAELSADGQTVFTVKKISTGETSVVQLLLDGQDVTTMLLPTTEEGSVKEVETLEKLTVEKKNGESVEVALEPLEGQVLDEEAKEKFEELNEQGSTRFQVEFVNEKTVRLYLDGKDIRPLLGSFKPRTSIELDETTNSDTLKDQQCEIINKNVELQNISEKQLAKDVKIINENSEILSEDILDVTTGSKIDENSENPSEEQVEDVCHQEIRNKADSAEEKDQQDEIIDKNVELQNISENELEEDVKDILDAKVDSTFNENSGLLSEEQVKDDFHPELINKADSEQGKGPQDEIIDKNVEFQNICENELAEDVKDGLGAKIGSTIDENLSEAPVEDVYHLELSDTTVSTVEPDLNIQAEHCTNKEDIKSMPESDNDAVENLDPEVPAESTCTTDSDIRNVEKDIEIVASSDLTSVLDSDLVPEAQATDFDIHHVKIDTELEIPKELPNPNDSDTREYIEASHELPLETEIRKTSELPHVIGSDIQEDKISTGIDMPSELPSATDSAIHEVLETSSGTREADSDIQIVKLVTELEDSSELAQEVKTDAELKANECKSVDSEIEATANLASETEGSKDPTKNVELILLTDIDLLLSGNTEISSDFKDDDATASVEETVTSVEQSVDDHTEVQVHLEEKQGLPKTDVVLASSGGGINDPKENISAEESTNLKNEVNSSEAIEKTDCLATMDHERLEDQPSTAVEDYLKDDDREDNILIDSSSAQTESTDSLLTEDKSLEKLEENKNLEADGDSKCIDETKELLNEKKASEKLPKSKKETINSAKDGSQKQSSSKLDKKSPVKEITTSKKPSPQKVTKEDNKITSPAKDSKSPLKKTSSEVSKPTTVKNSPKTPPTKSSPIRTSLCLPKNLSSTKEQESTAKSPPKKLVSDSKTAESKKTDLAKKKSPAKEISSKKIESGSSESIVKGVLKDIVDLACAGDNNQNAREK